MEALQSLSRIPEKHRENPFIFTEEVSEDGHYVSEAEYWENYYSHPDFSYEWNNGYLEEKPMTDLQGSLVYQWFCDILRRYFSTYPIGIPVNLEIGFRLALPRKKSVRKPDMGIVLNDNPVMMHLGDSSYKGTFDLCIESLSYSRSKEIKRDTVEKKKEYEGIGVKEYYILDARGVETAFYRLNAKRKYQKINPGDAGIICSQVLPGFQFRISDLYARPPLEQLAEDEVYRNYVLPFYSEVRQQLISERQKAEETEKQFISELISERQKTEQERQRADRLAAKLRELGIAS